VTSVAWCDFMQPLSYAHLLMQANATPSPYRNLSINDDRNTQIWVHFNICCYTWILD